MRKKNLDIEHILADNSSGVDQLREVSLERRVFVYFIIFAFTAGGMAFAALIKTGIVNHGFYLQRAIRNMSDTSIHIAPRGVIEDRFGSTLVHNTPSFNVFLLPRYLPENSEERNKIFLRITQIADLNFQDLVKKIDAHDWTLSDRILLASDITQDELVSFSSEKISGVSVEPGFKREPNIPLAFSHIIGYTGLVNTDDIENNPDLTIDDEIGRAGLEAYYDSDLRGLNGEEVTFKNARGKTEETRTTREAVPGDNIQTFIDKDFQEYFYNRLTQRLHDLGLSVAIGVAINPQNGEVLSLFNIPGYDPSHITNYLNDKNQPLFNRAVGGKYNPGSTIKPLVATAALYEGVVTPDTQIYSKGYIDVPNPYNPDSPSRFVDWRPQGWVNVISALARSSNVYFYEVGGGFENQKGLGITKLDEWWKKFGLDEKTGIDLPGESVGFLPTPEWKKQNTGEPWRLGDTYNVSIGQGDFSITPMELITYIGAIANGGTFYKPRVVNEIVDENQNLVKKTTPVILRDLHSEIQDVVSYVQRGMREGVTKSYGTSYLLHDLPFAVAAKTGSAQVQNNTKTNAFFVGYAPYDNPQIAILVLVENSREGSANTIPVAKDVLMWYYQNRLKNDQQQATNNQ